METSKIKRTTIYQIGTLFSVIIFLIIYILVNYFTLDIIERGPRLFFFLYFLEIIFLLSSLIFGFFWIHKKYGFKKSKYFLFAVGFCVIIIIAGITFSNIQTRKEYSYITVDNIQRQYIVHLPLNYNISKNYPLLVALHGGTGNAKQFESQSGFDNVADQNGFIVVYPDGLGLFEFSFHIWNSGYITPSLDNGVNDVNFLHALIFHLESTYPLNTSRIYMTGHSNGAMMTYRMASEYPQLFAGVASVAGSIGGKETPDSPLYTIPGPNGSVNIIEIHGLQDTNVLYNGGYSQTGYNAGQRYDDSVNQTISFWMTNNNCSTSPTIQNSTDNTISLKSYTGGVNNTRVELVTVTNQNHFWENLNSEVMKENFLGSSTLAELIWNLLTN